MKRRIQILVTIRTYTKLKLSYLQTLVRFISIC